MRSPVKSKRENSACPELHLLCTPKCLPLAAGTKLNKLNRNQISSPTTCFAHISREGGRVCPHLPSMHGSAADGNTNVVSTRSHLRLACRTAVGIPPEQAAARQVLAGRQTT